MRPKVKMSNSAETESKAESGVQLSAEAECLLKVRWYFRPKTKPNVRRLLSTDRKCSFPHILCRNQNRYSIDLYMSPQF